MSGYTITIPEQKYTLVVREGTKEFVILDSDGDEVTGVFDLNEDDVEVAAEGLVDKLLSDVVPDRIGTDVGDLHGEVTAFIEEQSG